MADVITGACLCKGVHFRARPPTLFCAHCHCRFCRRAHGAVFVTWFGVPESAFEITAGQRMLRWYRSSQQSRRGFCTQCGTTLFFASEASPGEMHIALATADGPIDRAPGAHVFFDHHVAWFEPGDSLPRVNSDDERLAAYRTIGE